MIMNTTKTDPGGLKNLLKAAMLLVVLGEQSSAELLQQLTEEEVQRVSREVAKITSISAEQAEAVLEEFHQMSTAGDYVARGGIDYARKLLLRAFDPEHAKRLLDRLTKALGADARLFRRHPEGRSAATRQVHSQRASADDCARPVAPQLHSSGRIVDLASPGASGRCGATHGQPRPDFPRYHHQDRRCDRAETEGAGRI